MRSLKILCLSITGCIALACTAPAYADHYEFDKSHTHIAFFINHLGYSDMLGIVSDYSGSFDFDPAHPENSKIDVTLRPDSITTSSDILDHVLRGSNFFNTDKFPDMHFASTSVKVTGDNTGDVIGNLTLLSATKTVVLHVHFNKAGYNTIDRKSVV